MKVAILGKLPEKWSAPFNDDEWQIWGCNVHTDFAALPRYDKWFDIHENPSQYPSIPREKLILRTDYPIDKILDMLPCRWLNNSMCYMLAYAAYLGAEEVCFYGCKLNNDHEIRTHQKECLRELRAYCIGHGMLVDAFASDVFKDYNIYK